MYEAWGMPDALEAAKETFDKLDEEGDHLIQYDKFKNGFKHIIEGIYLKGEYESVQTLRFIVQEAGRNGRNLKLD